ncbi:hypothetical protein LINPERHAP1_LOCUS22223 [Linum perenne]
MTNSGEMRYYVSSRSKASLMTNPTYRCMQIIFRETITQRGNAGGVYKARDLFMIRHVALGQRVHLVPLVSKLLASQNASNKVDFLVGGAYVTRLVNYFGCMHKFGQVTLQKRVTQILITPALPRSRGISEILPDYCPPLHEKNKGAQVQEDEDEEDTKVPPTSEAPQSTGGGSSSYDMSHLMEAIQGIPARVASSQQSHWEQQAEY